MKRHDREKEASAGKGNVSGVDGGLAKLKLTG